MLACLSICWLTRLVASRFPVQQQGRSRKKTPMRQSSPPFAFRQQKPGRSCMDGFATEEATGKPPENDLPLPTEEHASVLRIQQFSSNRGADLIPVFVNRYQVRVGCWSAGGSRT
jgi:hypothetical protein